MTTPYHSEERAPSARAHAPGPQRRWPARAPFGALLLSVVSCGDSRERPLPLGAGRPIPGCAGFEYRTCDILTTDCQRELFSLTSCMYGADEPGAAPPVLQLDEAEALALILETSAVAMTDGVAAMEDVAADDASFRAEVRGLELIGLLEPGTIETPDDVADATIDSLLAYYLIPTREVVVIDRGEPVDDLQSNVVLAHEFVHVLQDRRYDLGTFGLDTELDSDGYLARSSLIEGEASVYQYLLEFAYRGLDVRSVNFGAFFEQLAEFGMDLAIELGSPALTADSVFPYTFGARYAGERWVTGGNAALGAAYDAPPRTTWEVLGGDAAATLARFAQAPAPLDGYAAVTDDVAGAWVSIAMLAGLGDTPEVTSEWAELARDWRGDHLWVFDSPDAGVATLWALEWASAEAAERFGELAATLAPDGVASSIDTSGASTRITALERAEDLEAWRARLAEVVP